MTMPTSNDRSVSPAERSHLRRGLVASVHFDEPIGRQSRGEKTLKVTRRRCSRGWYWMDDQNVTAS